MRYEAQLAEGTCSCLQAGLPCKHRWHPRIWELWGGVPYMPMVAQSEPKL